MAKAWRCPRCSTANDESRVTCTRCGLLQGSVYVPTSWDAPSDPTLTPPLGAVSPEPASPSATAPTPAPAWPGAQQVRETVSPAPDRTVPSDDTAPADDRSLAAPDWTPYGGNQADAPAAPVPLWRRIPIGWLVVGIFVIGGAISSWYFGAARSDTGGIVKPGDLTATELRVGDCFDLKDPTAEEFEDVTARPCTQEHEFELFYAGSMPEGAYPADPVFEGFMTDNCLPAFLAYVGKEYEQSELDVSWLTPTTEAWNQGDRTTQCAVYHPRIHRLTESLKGSKR